MKRISLLFICFIMAYSTYAQEAPNFTIVDTDGNTIKLYEDLLDQDKIVVIKLFFVSCPICKPYNAPFQSLYEEFGEGAEDVEFLLLTTKLWDNNSDIADYRMEYGLTYPASGNDGGGYGASAPYRNGDFGTFFGAPSFIVIEPNRTAHFDIGGGGVTATMDKIRAKVNEIRDGTVMVETTLVNVNISDYKEGTLPSFKIYLRSADSIENRYLVPTEFLYPSQSYPELPNPEIFIDITEKSNVGITTFDLVTIQRHILNLLTLDNIQTLASDVNGSSSLTASDLLSMRKVILTIEDGFAVDKSFLSVSSDCNDDVAKCIEAIAIDTTLQEQEINFTVIKYGDVR